MQRRTCNSQALIDLEGKTIKSIHLSPAHGDVFEILFEDDTKLSLCTTEGLTNPQVEPDNTSLYITINEKPLFNYENI
jgi:hypothetical protein